MISKTLVKSNKGYVSELYQKESNEYA